MINHHVKLFPHVRYVMDKFRSKLPKEELKRHAKDVSKKLVSSDYKNRRVEDPTLISEKQEKKVKKYVKDYLDRAVEKYQVLENRRVENTSGEGSEVKELSTAPDADAIASVETPGTSDARAADEDAVMSDVADTTRGSPERKRKRDEDDPLGASLTPEETPSLKRLKEEETTEEPTPPPPPPPPGADMEVDMTPIQVEELTREQEEAQRLADEAEQDRIRQEEALQRENEEAERWFELEQQNHHVSTTNGEKHGAPGVVGASPGPFNTDGAMGLGDEARKQESPE